VSEKNVYLTFWQIENDFRSVIDPYFSLKSGDLVYHKIRGNRDIPMFNCLHCGESYFTAETLHEIEYIKSHRHELAVKSTVEVAQFA